MYVHQAQRRCIHGSPGQHGSCPACRTPGQSAGLPGPWCPLVDTGGGFSRCWYEPLRTRGRESGLAPNSGTCLINVSQCKTSPWDGRAHGDIPSFPPRASETATYPWGYQGLSLTRCTWRPLSPGPRDGLEASSQPLLASSSWERGSGTVGAPGSRGGAGRGLGPPSCCSAVGRGGPEDRAPERPHVPQHAWAVHARHGRAHPPRTAQACGRARGGVGRVSRPPWALCEAGMEV